MGVNASITFPKSLAIQVFWLIGRILSKINCKTQINDMMPARIILLIWICFLKETLDVPYFFTHSFLINTVLMPQPTHIPLCLGLTEKAVYPCFRCPAAWHL